MQLSEAQRDALVELLNIGFGRAGASLSKLTGQRVLLEVPEIAMCPVDQLNATLAAFVREEVASVHQVFSGPVAGDALLILDPPAAMALKQLLTDEPSLPLELDASAREVLTEIGNILLNACIGTFGNMLKVPLSFSVPEIDMTTIHSVVDKLMTHRDTLRFALVVTAGFRLRDSEVTGYVVIVLTVQSLTRLVVALDAWERSQR